MTENQQRAIYRRGLKLECGDENLYEMKRIESHVSRDRRKVRQSYIRKSKVIFNYTP